MILSRAAYFSPRDVTDLVRRSFCHGHPRGATNLVRRSSWHGHPRDVANLARRSFWYKRPRSQQPGRFDASHTDGYPTFSEGRGIDGATGATAGAWIIVSPTSKTRWATRHDNHLHRTAGFSPRDATESVQRSLWYERSRGVTENQPAAQAVSNIGASRAPTIGGLTPVYSIAAPITVWWHCGCIALRLHPVSYSRLGGTTIRGQP